MNDDKADTVGDRDRNDIGGPDDDGRNQRILVGDSLHRGHDSVGEYFSPCHPIYFPGSVYHCRRYLPVAYYYPPFYPIHDGRGDIPSVTAKPAAKTTDTSTSPVQSSQDWNLANPPSPLKRSATNPSEVGTPGSQAEGSEKSESICELSPSPVVISRTSASDEFIDPSILEAATALDLPLDGYKYSVTHWKGALKLCYRWKTTTNEDEREFYRASTTTNSLSSNNLKSVKSFCENILKRKSKRRQFAIHWKESGLKRIVDEASSSRRVAFNHDDQKLESVLDDYFSGRTRSTEYHQAREKVLEDRQKEIVTLWDALMSDPVLSDASSRQKLYLIQLAVERPYHDKKVEIETNDQKTIHDVTIEGYGGKSYWEQSDQSTNTERKSGTLHDALSKTVDEVLPVNKSMIDRFWKCVNEVDTRKRNRKRRRPSVPLVLSEENREMVDESNIEESPLGNFAASEKKCKIRENIQYEGDKENERSPIVPV